MGDEGTGCSATGDGVEHRGLHFHIAPVIQEPANIGNEFGTNFKGTAHFGIDNQVHIALAVAGLQIGEAVKLLRQGQQGLAEQGRLVDPERNLPLLGAEYIPLDPHNVANIHFFKPVISFRGLHFVHSDVELNSAGIILQITEHDLPHAALAHNTARQGDGFALHGLKMVLDLCAARVKLKLCLDKGVHAFRLKLRQLLPADLDLIAQRHLRCGYKLSHNNLSNLAVL